MSDSGKRTDSAHSQFDEMSSDELAELLRLDLMQPEGEGLDPDTILYIFEVMQKRKQAQPGYAPADAEAAWRVFIEKYLPGADGKSLYDDDDDNDDTDDAAGAAGGNDSNPAPFTPAAPAARSAACPGWP